MPLPAPLQTLTVSGTWPNPVGGDPLVGTAQLRAVRQVQSPAGDVILTTEPVVKTLSAGTAEWTGVLATDSTGLDQEVVYELQVQGDDGYFNRRLVELRITQAVGGVIQLADVADAVLGPAVSTYVLASAVGTVGGPAGPLDATGKVPAAQIPAGGATPDATTTSKGIVQLAGDLAGTAAAPTVPGKQPLDSDLTAIAGLSPANDDVIQRKAGAWTNRTPAQVKTDLALVKADVGLSNVDNTTDASKPISTATQTALDGKVDESVLDAKGDLYVGSAADTPARLAVGTNGQTLTADSAQSTGLAWRTPDQGDVHPLSGRGYHSASVDLGDVRASSSFAAWVTRIWVPANKAITKVGMVITAAGTLGAGGLNGFAFYSDDGSAKIGESLDDDTFWSVEGERTVNMLANIAAQSTGRFVRCRANVEGYSVGPSVAFAQAQHSAVFNGSATLQRRSAFTSSVSAWPATINPDTLGTPTEFLPLIFLG